MENRYRGKRNSARKSTRTSDGKRTSASRGSEPDKIAIPPKHATVTKSHRIIHMSRTPSPPNKKQKKGGGGGNKLLSFSDEVEDGNPLPTRADLSAGKGKPAIIPKNDGHEKNDATQGGSVGSGFKNFLQRLTNGRKKSDEQKTSRDGGQEAAENQFKDMYVVSPIWAPEYLSTVAPPNYAIQAEPERVSKETGATEGNKRSHSAGRLKTDTRDKDAGNGGAAAGSKEGVGSGADLRMVTDEGNRGGSGDTFKRLSKLVVAAMTKSGYVNTSEFSGPTKLVAVDPRMVRSWVHEQTKKLYLFWAFLLLIGSFLNSLVIFVFHFLWPVYAKGFLSRILMHSMLSPYGIIGVVIAIMLVIPLWGAVMLTHPKETNIFYRFTRWPFILAVLLYIVFNVLTQIYESINLHSDIKRLMVQNLSSPAKSAFYPTNLEKWSQDFYQCCGIYSYKDWESYGHLNRTSRPDLRGGYPTSCCKDDFPLCSHLSVVTLYPETSNTNEIQLWTNSCLQCEHAMVVYVLAVVLVVELFCVISTIYALFRLRKVIKQTNEYRVDHVHPFL